MNKNIKNTVCIMVMYTEIITYIEHLETTFSCVKMQELSLLCLGGQYGSVWCV